MDHFFPHLPLRANTTEDWCPSDSFNNYTSSNVHGANLYQPGQFTYTFNSDGFRCDNFSLESNLPIVFLGCSCTEGIGLPLEHTWSYQLLQQIRNKTGKQIPYWSLALGGSGVDTQASCLYWLSKKVKISHVFANFSPFHRREYCYEDNEIKMWGQGATGISPIHRVFSDPYYSAHQTKRSLMLIDSVISSIGASNIITQWGPNTEDTQIINEFTNLNYLPWQPTNVDLARDSMHFGPTYHCGLSAYLWDNIESKFT